MLWQNMRNYTFDIQENNHQGKDVIKTCFLFFLLYYDNRIGGITINHVQILQGFLPSRNAEYLKGRNCDLYFL